jgi:hypothetical protein
VPRRSKEEVRTQLVAQLTACMNLIDGQSKTEQKRLLSVRRHAWLALDALVRVDTAPLRELRARREFADALLGPLSKADLEQWLGRRQHDGLVE